MKIEKSTGYLLNTCAKFTKRTLEKKLNAYHVTTSQWAVLQLLFQENHALSQAEIAQKLNSDRATCGTILDKLITKELVTKQLDSDDRRSYKVMLTTKGTDLVPKLATFAEETNYSALSGFSETDIENLQNYLNKIIINLKEN